MTVSPITSNQLMEILEAVGLIGHNIPIYIQTSGNVQRESYCVSVSLENPFSKPKLILTAKSAHDI